MEAAFEETQLNSADKYFKALIVNKFKYYSLLCFNN